MSDIRQGRFKKQLVTPEQLHEEAVVVARQMAPLFQAWDRKALSDVQLVALWTLTYLRIRHPKTWWGAKRATPLHHHALSLPLRELPISWLAEEQHLLEQYQSLGDLFAHRALKATPEAVNRSILAWSLKTYGLVLMERIPSVEEVLEQQIRGQRCVTIFREQTTLSKLILGERDALGFAFHDLIHADHFFHDNSLMRGQIGFYRQVNDLLNAQLLAPFMAKESFSEQLDYLVADMNSHPVHLWKCFKSICRQANHGAMDELFLAELPKRWEMTDELSHAFDELNGPRFTDLEAQRILQLCERFGV